VYTHPKADVVTVRMRMHARAVNSPSPWRPTFQSVASLSCSIRERCEGKPLHPLRRTNPIAREEDGRGGGCLYSARCPR